MKHWLLAIALAGCGSVAPSVGTDGGGDSGSDGGASIPGKLVWQRNLFGSFPDVVTVVGDQLYVGASVFAQLDLGSGNLVPSGGDDLMFAHYNLDGALASAWRHGGTGSEDTLGFSIDPFGNAAIGVLCSGTGTENIGGADLPPVPAGSFESAAASFSDSGTLRWQVPITGTNQAFVRSASSGSTGLTAIAGSFNGTLTIGNLSRTATSANDNTFFATFDDTGKPITLLGFDGLGEDLGYRAIFDPLGTVIFTGTFSGKVNFGGTTLDAGTGADAFVVRMTPSGQVMWAIQGSSASDVGFVLAATVPNGDVILAIGYSDTFQMTGGDPVTSAGSTDIALVRVTSAGKVVWTKSFGGAGQDLPRDIAVGRGGEIALSAQFEGQASFGGDPLTAVGGPDAAIAKYTGDGAPLWSHAYGSGSDDRGLGIAVDAAGAVYAGVSFHGTIDFGAGPVTSTSSGTNYGGVLLKFSP